MPGSGDHRDPHHTGQLVEETHFTDAHSQEVADVLLEVGVGLAGMEDGAGHQAVRLQDGVGEQRHREVASRGQAEVPVEIVEHHKFNRVIIAERKIVLDKAVESGAFRNISIFLLHFSCQQEPSQGHQIQLRILQEEIEQVKCPVFWNLMAILTAISWPSMKRSISLTARWKVISQNPSLELTSLAHSISCPRLASWGDIFLYLRLGRRSCCFTQNKISTKYSLPKT